MYINVFKLIELNLEDLCSWIAELTMWFVFLNCWVNNLGDYKFVKFIENPNLIIAHHNTE